MKTLTIFLFASAAFAQQLTLTITNQGAIRAGDTVQLQANLTGATTATLAALQLDLGATVPGSWSVQPTASTIATGKSFTCALNASAYRCILWGMNSNILADGLAATISLAIPSSAPTGPATVTASNALGATGTGSAATLVSIGVGFTLGEPLSDCDLNRDGATNVQDLQLVGKTVVEQQRMINAMRGVCKGFLP